MLRGHNRVGSLPEGAGLHGPLLMGPRCQLAEQYGPVFTVHLGGQKTVVLTGYQAVREALVGTGQRLADRPPIPIFQLIQGGRGRFVMGEGPRGGAGCPCVGAVPGTAHRRAGPAGRGRAGLSAAWGRPQASSSPPGLAGEPPASTPCAPSTAWAWAGRPWPTRSCRSCGASWGSWISSEVSEGGGSAPRAPPAEARLPAGRPFPLALLGWAPANVTFTLLFGRRFDYQDPLFRSLLGLIDDVMVLLGTPGLQVRGQRSPPARRGEVAGATPPERLSHPDAP